MNKLNDIYGELYDEGVVLIDKRLSFSNGAKSSVLQLTKSSSYGIFIDSAEMTLCEETVAIAHEAGHVATGSTHAICSPFDVVAKHEYRANKWAIKKAHPER